MICNSDNSVIIFLITPYHTQIPGIDQQEMLDRLKEKYESTSNAP